MVKTTISCSEGTIDSLNKVIKKKIEYSIKEGTFDINELVKSKKGISYDKAVHWLCEFFFMFEKELKKNEAKDKIITSKFIKWFKSEKMNSIA